MKQIQFTFLLTVLMSMAGAKAMAYDIAVKNDDGVTIYYIYANNNKELEVTYQNQYYGTDYSGVVNIPASVTYNGNQYSVTSVGDWAFFSCDITSITIPNTVTTIGEWAFCNCNFSSIIIPNSITSIGQGAFQYCSNITSVAIPSGVTTIGEQAFSYCSGLTSIVVDSENPVYDSRNQCNAIIETSTNCLLNGCQTTVIPNSVTAIGVGAFSGCRKTSITIPNSVTSIGRSAFSSSSLTDITIPNSVTSIGSSAFSWSSLANITIPNSVTIIPYETFKNCENLTSITIPNSVTDIGDYAFGSCYNLTSITIGSSVTSIGSYAFSWCYGLTSVTSLIEEPMDIDESVFHSDLYSNEDVYPTAKLYVPAGTIDKYKARTGWQNFVNITGGIPSGIEVMKASADAVVRERYTLDGKYIGKPLRGLNIVRMSDGTTKKVVVK